MIRPRVGLFQPFMSFAVATCGRLAKNRGQCTLARLVLRLVHLDALEAKVDCIRFSISGENPQPHAHPLIRLSG